MSRITDPKVLKQGTQYKLSGTIFDPGVLEENGGVFEYAGRDVAEEDMLVFIGSVTSEGQYVYVYRLAEDAPTDLALVESVK